MDIKRLKQEVLEDMYSRTNNKLRILKEIEGSEELLEHIDKVTLEVINWLKEPASYTSLNILKERMVKYKPDDIKELIIEVFSVVLFDNRAKTIQQVAGAGIPFFADTFLPFDAVKITAEIVGIMCSLDLVDVIPAMEGQTEYTMVQTDYELTQDIIDKIHETKYMPPMIVKPNHVRKVKDNAYLTFKSNMILGDKHNQHDMGISLDVVNIQNSIPLRLNEFVLGLREESSKPLDTPEKIHNFTRMTSASRDVYNLIMETGNVFYNTHAFDMRGRLYSQGYYVHIQSTEYKKALIDFYYQEVITHEIEE
jgi:hypothetical protein